MIEYDKDTILKALDDVRKTVASYLPSELKEHTKIYKDGVLTETNEIEYGVMDPDEKGLVQIKIRHYRQDD